MEHKCSLNRKRAVQCLNERGVCDLWGAVLGSALFPKQEARKTQA